MSLPIKTATQVTAVKIHVNRDQEGFVLSASKSRASTRYRGEILSHARISAKNAFFALNNLRLLENHYKKTKQRKCHG